MKLLINRNPVREQAWGGGAWFVNAIYDNAQLFGHQILTVEDVRCGKYPDVMLLVGLDADEMGLTANVAVDYARTFFLQRGIKIPIVIRVNECDARKGTIGVDNAWRMMSQRVDGTIFVSEWLKNYFEPWDCNNSRVVKNGVDSVIFKPVPKVHDGRLRLVTHHWSNNVMKGFDIYDELDNYVGTHPNVEFTYVGRERGTFKHTRIVPPLHGLELGAELVKHDVYISASRFDPGPNHVVESISCGLPTYVHANGGGCVEFAGIDHTYKSWEELKNILNTRKFVENSTKFGTWRTCAEQCFEFLESFAKQE